MPRPCSVSCFLGHGEEQMNRPRSPAGRRSAATTNNQGCLRRGITIHGRVTNPPSARECGLDLPACAVLARTACPFHPSGCGLGSRLPHVGSNNEQGPGTGHAALVGPLQPIPGLGSVLGGFILQLSPAFPQIPQIPWPLGTVADASAFPAVALTGLQLATFPCLESRGYTSTLGAFTNWARPASCDGMSNG